MPTPSVARHYGYLRIDNRRSGAIIFSSRAILRGRVAAGQFSGTVLRLLGWLSPFFVSSLVLQICLNSLVR